jgi:hypothetical protein
MVQDMHCFLSEYSSTVVLAPHTIKVSCGPSRVVLGAHRVVGPGTHRGSGPRKVHTTGVANVVAVVAHDLPPFFLSSKASLPS